MKKTLCPLMLLVASFFLGSSCTFHHFGVSDRAMGVPAEFEQTEFMIVQAERSPGARYCPEKIADAKALAKKAADTYWACRTNEAMELLAEARRLAKEARVRTWVSSGRSV